MKQIFQKTKSCILLSCTLSMLLVACGGEQTENSNKVSLKAPPIAAIPVWSLPKTRANYTIVKTLSGYQAFDLISGQVSTIPAEVTSIAFADMRQNLTIEATAKLLSDADLKQLIQLYVAYFNRLPDADGLEYWIQRKAQGMSMQDIAESFFDSAVKFSELTGYQPICLFRHWLKLFIKMCWGGLEVMHHQKPM